LIAASSAVLIVCPFKFLELFRWNEKLFREMYLAYLDGRAEKDPGDFWYKGEIGM